MEEEGGGVSMSNNIIRWDGQGISVGDWSHEVSGLDRSKLVYRK